jgi:hypothetical protein
MKTHTALTAHQAMNAVAIFPYNYLIFPPYSLYIPCLFPVDSAGRKRSIRASNICFARYFECAKRLSLKTHIRAKKINPRGVCGVSLRRTT